MDNLRAQTIHSLNWMLVAQTIRETLRFVISVILARILEPDAFGQIAMVFVITGFARLFTNIGLGDAAIQLRETTDEHYSVVFWTSLVAGLTMTALFALLSPVIAAFYRCPSLRILVLVMSLDFTIGSLHVLPNALLRKTMQFHTLALIETSAVIFAGIAAIVMACNGMGVWSLVVYSMASSLAITIFSWLTTRRQAIGAFHFFALRSMLSFGLNLMGFNALNYFTRQLDNLLIGRHLGASPLGFYSRAYNLMLLPVLQINQVASRVMFSTLCLIKDDKERVARTYLRSVRLISFVTFPTMIGMCVVAEPFVLAVFGAKWIPVVPVLRLLSLVGMNHSVSTTCGWLFRSQGRTDLLFHWAIFSCIATCISFIVGIRWGITGVALAYTLCTYGILWYPLWHLAGKLVGLSFTTILSPLTGNFLAALAMAILVKIIAYILPPAWLEVTKLTILITTGMVTYALLVHCFKNASYIEIRQLLLQHLQIGRYQR